MHDVFVTEDNKNMLDSSDFLLYFCNTAGRFEGEDSFCNAVGITKTQSKFHRMLYLTKKELEKSGSTLEYEFPDTLFDGPYDRKLQHDLGILNYGEFIDYTSIPSLKSEKVNKCIIAPRILTRLYVKGIVSPMLKKELGRKNFKKISKLIKELNEHDLKTLDSMVGEIEKDKIKTDYISLNILPEDVRELIENTLQET